MPVKKSKVKSQKIEKKTTKTVKKVDGITVDVYDTKGKVIDKMSLPKELFGARVNPVLMAQAVRVYLANQRKGTAKTKTRGEVVASTKKIYRQKGTGRARHGAISAPIFVGGGVVFGPKPRDFALAFPKKMKRKALMGALTTKLQGNAVKVVDGLEKLVPKTKRMDEAIKRVIGDAKNQPQRVLIVTPGKIESVQRAARNIEGVMIRPVDLLSTYEILNTSNLLFMKDAIEKLEELWSQKQS